MTVSLSALRLRFYPDPALRRKAETVADITDDVRSVAERMIQMMGEADGIGLAATQVGLPWRLFVAHTPPPPEDEAPADIPGDASLQTATDQPIVCVNPELSGFEGAPAPYEEGCLSLPEIRGDVLRPPGVTLRATDLSGEPFTIRCGGLLARCVQHEYDHLEGVLIIDRMTQLSRLKCRTPLRDLERHAKQP